MKLLLTSLLLAFTLSLTLAGCVVDSAESEGDTEAVGEAQAALTAMDCCEVCVTYGVVVDCRAWVSANIFQPSACLSTVKNFCPAGGGGTCTLQSGQTLTCAGSTNG
ncbi:MAG: hypothetical protein U0359_21165 [Byssovorax sp.]